MLVIADLLGVPEVGPRDVPRRARGEASGRSGRQHRQQSMAHNPLEFLYARFTEYVEDRRREPARRRADRPRDRDLPRRLAARGHRRRPHRREPVRGRPGDDGAAARERAAAARRAPGPPGAPARPSATASRTSSRRRCASRARSRATSGCHASPTTVGGVDIPAGTTRDGAQRRRQPRPAPLRAPGRVPASTAPNARQHIAFGHGVHTCPGAPLARAEGRVSIERILDRMRDITISEAEHGPRRRAPLRLRADVHPPRPHRLHLEFTPASP